MTSAPPRFPRSNNIEWLRLLFALQVVIWHAAEHIGSGTPQFLAFIPGVPAFFFVSGFLIYASFCNAPDKRYFENRILRLYPGLILVTAGGLVVVLIAKGFADLAFHPKLYGAWFAAQLTLGQAFNPSHFRDVGVGVVNGSLWTITVELLFYLTVPIIVWMERHIYKHTVAMLTGASFAIFAAGPSTLNYEISGKPLYDYLELTPVAWGWMFGFGILAVKNWELLQPRLKLLPLAILPMGAMAVIHSTGPFFNSSGNQLGLFYFIGYCCLVTFLAFGVKRVPLNFDLSYGTYIWHMPIINLLIVLGFPDFTLAVLLTVGIAAMSWFFIEKPALRLKHKSLKRVRSASRTGGRDSQCDKLPDGQKLVCESRTP